MRKFHDFKANFWIIKIFFNHNHSLATSTADKSNFPNILFIIYLNWILSMHIHTQKSIKTTLGTVEQEKIRTWNKNREKVKKLMLNDSASPVTLLSVKYIFQSHLYIKSSVKSSEKLLNYTRSPAQSVTRRKKRVSSYTSHNTFNVVDVFHSCTRRENENESWEHKFKFYVNKICLVWLRTKLLYMKKRTRICMHSYIVLAFLLVRFSCTFLLWSFLFFRINIQPM